MTGGWGGIRTPGAFRHTRSPGVHNQPLCHPSKRWIDNLTISILSPRMTCRGSCQLLVPARCSRRPAGDALRMPNTSPRRFPQGSGYRLSAAQLQSPEQFVERQLDTDVKLTEIRVLSADRIKA